VKAGSGAATLGVPDSAGVPASLSRDTIVLPYNNIDAAARLFKRAGRSIAAVIVEPVAANMGVVMPDASFLVGLRELATRYKCVLIFDEVITGFRFTYGGVQQLFGIEPDLTCLGKIIGGGLPLAAYGGSRRIMQQVAPLGPVYQAGTLSGNPAAVSAGIAVLDELSRRDYVQLNQKAAVLCDSFQAIIRAAGKAVTVNRAGSIFTVFFTAGPVRDFTGAVRADRKAYARFFWKMLEAGVSMPPAQFEGNFLSFCHSDTDIHATVAAFASALTGCPSCSKRG
jgi:glutamate-1-semialdehyde 2,1-aminomutase